MIVVPQSFALASAHDAFDGDGQLKDGQAERLVGEVGASLFSTAARLS